MGLAVGMAIGAAMSGLFGGPFKGPVLINGMPAANTGMRVKGMPVHVPIGGVSVNPPKNEGTIITGSKTVHVLGASGARLTSMVITCSDPINLPTSVVMSIPMGVPVFTGGTYCRRLARGSAQPACRRAVGGLQDSYCADLARISARLPWCFGSRY